MRHKYKFLFAIVGTALVTSTCTAYFAHKNTMRSFIDSAVEMDALNYVGRVETYDFLEEMIAKGCNKEALDYIKYEQTFWLYGIRNRMQHSDEIKIKVMERNREVAERALNENSLIGGYTRPRCK